MKSFKLVVTGTAILMAIVLVSTKPTTNNIENGLQNKSHLQQDTANAKAAIHAISYQVNLLY